MSISRWTLTEDQRAIVGPFLELIWVAFAWSLPPRFYGTIIAWVSGVIAPHPLPDWVRWTFVIAILVPAIGSTIVFGYDCYAAIKRRLRLATQDDELRLRSHIEIRRLSNELQ
jgi:hypothetical protein